MKKILIPLLFISGSVFAQKIPDLGFDKIRIAEADKTIQAELKPVNSNPSLEADRFYYWYSGNSIHSTQGGFSGRLLNGQYAEYYLSKNLKEQGAFKKGLKDGIWRSWNDNGTLIQYYTWEKGIKSGKFNLFDDHGGLKQSGSYRNNTLDGRIQTYNGNDQAAVVTYNAGVIIANKPSFWEKINILKKKDKTPQQKPGKTTPIKNKQ